MPGAVDFLTNEYHRFARGQPRFNPQQVVVSTGLYEAIIDEFGANLRFAPNPNQGHGVMFRGMVMTPGPIAEDWFIHEWTMGPRAPAAEWRAEWRLNPLEPPREGNIGIWEPEPEEEVFDVSFD